jgi:hypothetical protein
MPAISGGKFQQVLAEPCIRARTIKHSRQAHVVELPNASIAEPTIGSTAVEGSAKIGSIARVSHCCVSS